MTQNSIRLHLSTGLSSLKTTLKIVGQPLLGVLLGCRVRVYIVVVYTPVYTPQKGFRGDMLRYVRKMSTYLKEYTTKKDLFYSNVLMLTYKL